MSLKVEGLTVKSGTNLQPEATTFTNTTGEIAQYFFKNNPWKPATNLKQKIFRFCVICGDNRFTNEEWASLREMWGLQLMVCSKSLCEKVLANPNFPTFVSRKHYIVETAFDKKRVASYKEEEFTDEIMTVTSHLSLDRVYKDESEIPNEYRETFKKLENIPVSERITKIDSIYFDHVENHAIKIGTNMSDTTDPFLKKLAWYREQSVTLLNNLKNK